MKSDKHQSTVAIPAIEEEIQQTRPFQSSYQKAVVNLMFTYNQVMEFTRINLDPHGLTVQQYNVLRILRGAKKPLTTSVIRERMLDRMSDTSRLVDRLVRKGLVARNTCPEDRRLVDVTITGAGRELLSVLDDSMSNQHAYSGYFTAEDAENLSNLLDRLRTSVQTNS